MNLSGQSNYAFPEPPSGKSGWPWTSKASSFEPLMPDGKQWPRISIVTPSYNQGDFLEETIRSILLQNYPNLEYIVIDGGSSDNSVNIIKKYEPWINYWISEKDAGQAHAINKGLYYCTGDIFNWINSDDNLTEGSLEKIAQNIGNYDALAGAVINFDTTKKTLVQSAGLSPKKMLRGDLSSIYQQPGTWLRVDKLKNIGGLDESFHYCFDWLMTIRYLNNYENIKYITDVLANFRLHNNSKTVNSGSDFRRETLLILINLMYSKEFRSKYSFDSLQYIHKALWVEEIDRFSRGNRSNVRKVSNIFSAIIWNYSAYPYRYALGAIKKLIL